MYLYGSGRLLAVPAQVGAADFPVSVALAAAPRKAAFGVSVAVTSVMGLMRTTASFPVAATLSGAGTRVETQDAILSVLDDTLKRAPTAVTVSVMHGWAGDQVQFAIDGNIQAGTYYLDSDGAITALSLAVGTQYGAGVHTVTMTSLVSAPGYTTSDTFTLEMAPPASARTIGADADPVAIPAAESPTGVYAWVLQDLLPGGLGSYVMPQNPASMTSPQFRRQLAQSHTTSVASGRYHITEVADFAAQWSFAGVCFTQEHHDKLVAYAGLNRRFYVIDHRNRAWIVAITGLDMVARKRMNVNGVTTDWGHDYTVQALIYDQDWRVPQ